MAAATTLATQTTLPHKPVAISVTANQWRVYALHPGACAVSFQCKTADTYGVLFGREIDTDCPDDTDVSSGAGDFDLADCMTFVGAVSAADRPTPTIPLGRPYPAGASVARPTLVAISSTSSCTVYVTQLGGDQ